MKKFFGIFLFLFLNAAYAKVYPIKVTEKGYEPSKIQVDKDEKVILAFTRTTDQTCATSVEVPAKHLHQELPLNKEVQVDLGILNKKEIVFGCAMGMMVRGTVVLR